jgi:hypothetical protein
LGNCCLIGFERTQPKGGTMGAAPVSDRSHMAKWAKCGSAPARPGGGKFDGAVELSSAEPTGPLWLAGTSRRAWPTAARPPAPRKRPRPVRRQPRYHGSHGRPVTPWRGAASSFK